MIFALFFQKYVNKKIKIELKNGMIFTGILVSTDAFLNFKLKQIEIEDQEKYPGLNQIELISIRGSSVKTIQVDKNDDLIDSLLLATRNRFIINQIRETEANERDKMEGDEINDN